MIVLFRLIVPVTFGANVTVSPSCAAPISARKDARLSRSRS
jgi:hypothetical protein